MQEKCCFFNRITGGKTCLCVSTIVSFKVSLEFMVSQDFFCHSMVTISSLTELVELKSMFHKRTWQNINYKLGNRFINCPSLQIINRFSLGMIGLVWFVRVFSPFIMCSEFFYYNFHMWHTYLNIYRRKSLIYNCQWP